MELSFVPPIEAGESVFSFVIRFCRWNDVDMQSLLGGHRITDRTGFRDFPIAASRLESLFNVDSIRRHSLLTRHSAATYYATTVPDPFRSESLKMNDRTASNLLRISMASNWSHLRYCRQCAASEFERCRYSWWHRDHQLPLESICSIHKRPLECLHLDQLGLRLPHEFLAKGESHNQRAVCPTELEKIMNRYEYGLATGKGRRLVKGQCECIIRTLASITSDYVEQAEMIMPSIRMLVLALRDQAVNEPRKDWERVHIELLRLLRDGFDYSDVVAAILLVVSLTYPLSFGCHSLPKNLQDAWKYRNHEAARPDPSC